MNPTRVQLQRSPGLRSNSHTLMTKVLASCFVSQETVKMIKIIVEVSEKCWKNCSNVR